MMQINTQYENQAYGQTTSSIDSNDNDKKSKLILITASLILLMITMFGLSRLWQKQQNITKLNQAGDGVALSGPILTPTSIPVMAEMKLTTKDNNLVMSIKPSDSMMISGISLKLDFDKELNAKQKQSIEQSITLDQFWRKAGYRLLIKQFNPKDDTLELALLNMQPQVKELNNQTRELITFHIDETINIKNISLSDRESLISLKSGKSGKITLK